VGRPLLDMTQPETIEPALAAAGPDIVVNAAATTAVDAAERDPDLAYATNATGAGAVASAAAELGVPVLHISTDYVFRGDAAPYREGDAKGPVNVYGKSKLKGEELVAAANPRHLILRVAWVHSPFGQNFVKAMLKAAATQPAVEAVSDQWGSPTSGLDLADAIFHAAGHLLAGAGAHGIYHLAGSGGVNRSGLTRHLLDTSRRLGGPAAEVRETASNVDASRAPRPRDTRLDCEKFAAAFGWRLPDWHDGVDVVVERIFQAEKA
jgi:dTDP-4-dehydrorhamnose reductase